MATTLISGNMINMSVKDRIAQESLQEKIVAWDEARSNWLKNVRDCLMACTNSPEYLKTTIMRRCQDMMDTTQRRLNWWSASGAIKTYDMAGGQYFRTTDILGAAEAVGLRANTGNGAMNGLDAHRMLLDVLSACECKSLQLLAADLKNAVDHYRENSQDGT